MLPRSDNRRLYALLGVLFVLALAYQVGVSAGMVALKAAGPGQLPVVNWIFTVSTTILTPAFCLLLGFFVAGMRPRDPLAWLLLALMLSFAQLSIRTSGSLTDVLSRWPDILRPAALFYNVLFANTWSIWILLFGIYFPERLGLDRRWPWLKWLVIAPIAIDAVGTALPAVGPSLGIALGPLESVVLLLQMAAVSGFFFSVGTKIGEASSADARRRLTLLINGTGIALAPLFFLAIYGLFRGFENLPQAFLILCIPPLALFPITLAYVIVVHRALDVRVVIRQGLRYALAKRGVRVLQILAIAVVILGAATLATDSSRNRPAKIEAIALGVTAVILISRGSEKLRGWVDRRFFREAYNAEQILRELSDQVRTMVETGPLLETVARQISGSLHVPRVAMLVKDNGLYAPAYALGFSELPSAGFASSAGTVEELKRDRQPLRVYFDDPDSWVYRAASVSDSEREQLHKLESQLLLPLAFKDKLIGFMSLGAKKSEEPYSASDVHLLQSVATQTGLALESSHLTEAIAVEVAQRERLNRELEIAREVQERLFPQNYPAIPGLDYAGRCRPAQGVGGDYYDFLELTDGRFGIAVGDVSGKGVPAALLMASLQASLRGQTISGSPDLAKLMTNVNRLIFETSPSNRYATFFYGEYQPATRQFAYVNGGHNPPLVFRNGDVLRLEDGGPVVGLFKPARYSQANVDLASGDVLLFYTDGISEAMNSADEEWGEERMMEAARACESRPALEMIDELMRAADAFVAGAPQHDDMTVMVVKVL
ncbi:MAG TPA: GAF domain-containing SpoIIE family protein phosphatase [Bryobacteraceae bacterium]|jgi:sigma-B regulation protein RsbU (phosphoserine phosphatase)|nr:GAF domain-containing SpoIIE family protein phosphatase [Bryobacteraceae bacterium]